MKMYTNSDQTAQLIEKGFDVPTAKNYRHENGATCNAPTQSLLQRWLREEKGILALVKYDVSGFSQSFGCEIQQIGTSNYALLSGFATYELALEDALKYALENLV